MRNAGLIAIALGMVCASRARAQSEDYVREQIDRLRSRSERERIEACETLWGLAVRALPAAPHLARVVISDRSAKVRSTALDALEHIGPSALDTAVDLLLQKDPAGRSAGARLLQWWDAKLTEDYIRPHLAGLVRALDFPECRWTCATLLERKGGLEAVEPLLLLLSNRDDATRAAAIRALAGPGRHDLAAVLERLEGDSRSEVRAGAAESLGRMGEAARECADALVQSLEDKSDQVVAQAAIALGRIGERPAAVVPRILDRFVTDSPEVRDACCRAAARFGGDALPFLRDLLVAEQAAVRDAARAAYGLIGKTAGAALVTDLGDADTARRIAALEALRVVVRRAPSQEWIDALEPVLGQEDPAVLAAGARAAGACGRNAVNLLRPLLRLAESEVPAVRAAALIAVGDLAACFDLEFEGDYLASHFAPVDGMRELIASAAKSPDPAVRAAAVVAGAALDGPTPDSLKRLTELMGQGGDAALAALGRLERYGFRAAPALPAVVEAGKAEDPRVRCAAMVVLERCACGCDAQVAGREARARKLPRDTRDALERAFAWLSAHQDVDGMWDCDDWMKHDDSHGSGVGQWAYDAGVTGLALLAMMGVGVERDASARTLTIRRGLRWLVSTQTEEGVYSNPRSQHFIIGHAIATFAVGEGALALGDEALLDSCARGAAYLEDARNPEMAWRYEPRGGENDTHCTVWAIAALAAARRAGVRVDPATFEGARAWLENMSDEGMVGYNSPGGGSARPEGLQEQFPIDLVQPMTAAGLWGFALLGGADDASALADTIAAYPPRWSRPKGSIDFCYWFFGAQGLYAAKARCFDGWYDKLTDALVPMQAKDGSWDPAGVWGEDGGRVYSTAIGALALLAPARIDPSALGDRHGDKVVRDAVKALRAAESDSDPRVAYAAWAALNSIPGARK